MDLPLASRFISSCSLLCLLCFSNKAWLLDPYTQQISSAVGILSSSLPSVFKSTTCNISSKQRPLSPLPGDIVPRSRPMVGCCSRSSLRGHFLQVSPSGGTSVPGLLFRVETDPSLLLWEGVPCLSSPAVVEGALSQVSCFGRGALSQASPSGRVLSQISSGGGNYL